MLAPNNQSFLSEFPRSNIGNFKKSKLSSGKIIFSRKICWILLSEGFTFVDIAKILFINEKITGACNITTSVLEAVASDQNINFIDTLGVVFDRFSSYNAASTGFVVDVVQNYFEQSSPLHLQ